MDRGQSDHLIIVGLSGGYDSTALMFECLRAGYSVHAHHINIRDSADGKIRWLGEKRAVEQIIFRAKDRFGDLLVGYSESDYGFSTEQGWGGSDKVTATFMLCVVCDGYLRTQEDDSPGARFSKKEQPWLKVGPKRFNQIDMAEGQTASESFYNEHREVSLVEGYFKHLEFSQPKPQLLFPFRYLDKKDVLKLIPDDVQRYCFTCRKPDPFLKQCGKCSACVRLANARA